MDWILRHAWEAWLGLAIVLGVAEMFSLDLILVMLAAGAIVGMVAAVLGLPVAIQVVAFAGVSVAARLLEGIRQVHALPEVRARFAEQGGVPVGVAGRVVEQGEAPRARLAREGPGLPGGEVPAEGGLVGVEEADADEGPVPFLDDLDVGVVVVVAVELAGRLGRRLPVEALAVIAPRLA